MHWLLLLVASDYYKLVVLNYYRARLSTALQQFPFDNVF